MSETTAITKKYYTKSNTKNKINLMKPKKQKN